MAFEYQALRQREMEKDSQVEEWEVKLEKGVKTTCQRASQAEARVQCCHSCLEGTGKAWKQGTARPALHFRRCWRQTAAPAPGLLCALVFFWQLWPPPVVNYRRAGEAPGARAGRLPVGSPTPGGTHPSRFPAGQWPWGQSGPGLPRPRIPGMAGSLTIRPWAPPRIESPLAAHGLLEALGLAHNPTPTRLALPALASHCWSA